MVREFWMSIHCFLPQLIFQSCRDQIQLSWQANLTHMFLRHNHESTLKNYHFQGYQFKLISWNDSLFVLIFRYQFKKVCKLLNLYASFFRRDGGEKVFFIEMEFKICFFLITDNRHRKIKSHIFFIRMMNLCFLILGIQSIQFFCNNLKLSASFFMLHGF